jgi:hypothetical protein
MSAPCDRVTDRSLSDDQVVNATRDAHQGDPETEPLKVQSVRPLSDSLCELLALPFRCHVPNNFDDVQCKEDR